MLFLSRKNNSLSRLHWAWFFWSR